MKNLMKRSVALLLVLFLCLSWLPANLVSVDAANYIYNWGTRGDTATTLSENAKAFYTGSNTYDALSALSGGTGASDAPSSSLYKALKNLMSGKQTYQTSYDATRDMFKYTDCENGGGAISSFYSGKDIGPSWDSGDTWNREHTWPNSKGDASGNGENDIMMLRPTAKSENGSRGNKAYGESSGFYNPNSESGGSLDLRGDVSRILLYVYVRWGNTVSMWGASGVIESLDVLIKWMEADPVDTWELGRNDSVQSITGTRNVFVDYPEFAFILFGEEIPENMTTPSGEAANAAGCDHNYVAGEIVAPTCTVDGYTIYICTLCSRSTQRDVVAASHKFVNGTCTACGEVNYEVADTLVPGTAYKLGLFSTSKNATYYFTGVMSGYYGATETAYEKGVDVFVEETDGGYYLYFLNASGVKQYINLVASGTYKNFTFATTASSVYTWDAEKNALYTTIDTEVCYIGTYGSYVTMGVLQTSKLKDTDYIARLYAIGGSSVPEQPTCQHQNTKVEGAKDATCTEAGHTGKTVCSDCGTTVNEGSAITAPGHSFVNGTCSVCGAVESAPAEPTFVTSITAGTAYKLGLFSTSKNATYYFLGTMSGYYGATETVYEDGVDVFVEETTGGYHLYFLNAGGVKQYINLVASGTYKNFTFAATASSVYTWDAEKNALYTTVDTEVCYIGTYGTYVTMGVLQTSKLKDTDYIARLYTMGGSSEPEQPTCQHQNTTVEGAKDATCTEAGHTGKTVCSDCGATVNAGSVITATGHNFVGGTCSVCGEKKPTASVTTATISFADKAQRTEYSSTKQVWVQNGITVTNEKGSSTSNVGDYVKPARFYKSSNLKIEYPGMTKIVIDCTGMDSKYVTPYKDSITDSNATVSIDNQIVTITFAQPVDSFAISKLAAQVRANSITITAEAAVPACEHKNTNTEGAKAATCTTDGHTGKTVCADCGELISEGNVIPATGHSYVEGTCTKCGAADPNYTPDVPACQHTNTNTEGAKAATCTTDGHTGKTVCTDCGETTNDGNVIPATGHSYVNGTCSACGEKEPAAPTITTATISFANKAQRTEFSTSKQVWAQNGITVTNLKAASTSNVADYVNPARFYAGSSLKVEYPGMTKIEFTCNSSSYANDLKNSIGSSAACTVSGSKVTVTFDAPQDSFQIAKLTKQVRMNSITVTAEAAAPACEHKNTTVEGAKGATCTTDGHTGKITCTDCGEVIDEGKVVPAPGHNYVDYFCSGCGEMDPDAPKHTVYFLVPGGVSEIAPLVSDPKGITLPAAATVEGYTFLGWVTNTVNNVTEQVECLKAGDQYVAQDTTYLYALYTYEKTTTSEGTSGTANISFANKAQRTEFSTSKQVWAQNGITVTNLKASSSSNVADYANPARFYAGSSLKVEYPGMTKIEFTCNSSSYANDLKNSIGSSATCTVSGSKVTVTFDAPQDSFQIAKLTKQVRMNSIAVTYSIPGSEETATYYTTVIGEGCAHSNLIVETKDATCTEAGYKNALICSDCKTILAADETVSALGHKPGAEATCTTAQTCTVCNTVLVKELGHKPGAEATCTTAQTCTVCNTVLVKELGHKPGAEATCTTAQTCTVCNTVLVKELGHKPGAEATCTTAQTCTVCNAELVKALGHKPGAEATCTTAQTCTVCNAELVKALGHKPGAEATCTTAQTCTVCNAELVKALGHKPATDAAVAPTCTKTGLTEGSHCSVCDTVLKAQETVAALGHKPGAEATCETAQTCTRCDYVYEEALKHKYSETWNSDEKGHWHVCSRCAKKGSYADHSFENACDVDCSVCDYTRTIEHTLNEEWSFNEENHWHDCTVCGQKQDETAHVPGPEATATTEQVCTACGYVLAPALGEVETVAPTTEETPATTEPAAPTVDEAKGGSFPWWIPVVVVVLVGGIAVVVIKKKEN